MCSIMKSMITGTIKNTVSDNLRGHRANSQRMGKSLNTHVGNPPASFHHCQWSLHWNSWSWWPDKSSTVIGTQNFMPHGILGTGFFRRTPALSAQSCVKYQMGSSRFDEVELHCNRTVAWPLLDFTMNQIIMYEGESKPTCDFFYSEVESMVVSWNKHTGCSGKKARLKGLTLV